MLKRVPEPLQKVLLHLEAKNLTEWTAALCERKLAEMCHADKLRNETKQNKQQNVIPDTLEELDGNRKFYSTTEKSDQYITQWMAENAPGKIVLDYACGDGGTSFHLAEVGAMLCIGLDISPVSIGNCRIVAKCKGIDNTFFVVGDCEKTEFPDNSVDVIVCTGMLHHLDLSYAFPEMRRILKPGGVCLALEALGYNPIIKLYRAMTPNLRTEWEKAHILSLKDVRFAQRFFNIENVCYWHLLSIGATPFRRFKAMKYILNVANTLDDLILRVPFLQRMAWMFSFELHKPLDG
jgi:ubiquinone/menaquinone biosynthesis C-methylase UbiE